jgi:hypothetical protein
MVVPFTLVVLLSAAGISAATNARNVGAAALPVEGPAKTVFAVSVAKVPVNVPEVVTGEPLTVKIAGRESATLVTVPLPPPQTPFVASQMRAAVPPASLMTPCPEELTPYTAVVLLPGTKGVAL